jgi:hypothetical protein
MFGLSGHQILGVVLIIVLSDALRAANGRLKVPYLGLQVPSFVS